MCFDVERGVAIEAVLQASKGAQAILNLVILNTFPNDFIVGEEDTKELSKNSPLRDKVVGLVNSILQTCPPLTEAQVLNAIDRGNHHGGPNCRFWTLDPIDGTKGFLRGGQFAVCLALIVNGAVELGVLGCPNLPIHGNDDKSAERGVLMVAVRGCGSYQMPMSPVGIESAIITSSQTSADKALFCESVEALHSDQDEASRIAGLLGITKPSLRMDSQCKYAAIARGDADIYLRIPTNAEYQENIWDHASGSLIVSEAGGKVCDMNGQSLDFSMGRTLRGNSGIIATNGKIHSAVVVAAKNALSSSSSKI